MTVNASSSSATVPPEHPRPDAGPAALRLDLLATGRLAPVAAAALQGKADELLSPLRYLPAGDLPEGPSVLADRRRLAEGLAVANESYGHPRARELAGKLAEPKTLVVVTGQQPGLFGGPLYGLSKMVAAARWAAHLEASGQPAVAVFWVATEDHDFAEVSKATFLGPQDVASYDLGEDPQPLLPVGMRTLGPNVQEVLSALEELFPGERAETWWRTVGRWYRPDARFGEAFCRLMVGLLGERCPLMLDALLPAVKEAEAPWLRRFVERREAFGDAVAEAHRQVEEAGLPLQVTPQPRVSPLFLLRGQERRRIEWRGEGRARFRLRGDGGSEEPVDELLRILDENPSVVGPGVLARPAIQDAILGTALQVIGPGELSYMVQASAAYGVLEVPAPRTVLRPQVIVLEPRHRRWIEELDLTLEELLGDERDLESRLARRAGVDLMGPAAQRIDAVLEQVRGPAVALDANLDKPWERTRDQILKNLDQFAGRVRAAAARSNEVERQRLHALRTLLLPSGKLQERQLSTAHFPAKYGDGLVAALWEQMDLDPRYLQTITLR
ncbi:MAG: bacillithiol biosynthesis cysteine-adding enzyme BshC [Acidobacteria bacterium]|nr:bacillithiol biosynthesis cysteine-adding enzyme BshC [Acidobacteriota bacterium]